jgi:hypothetical protein
MTFSLLLLHIFLMVLGDTRQGGGGGGGMHNRKGGGNGRNTPMDDGQMLAVPYHPTNSRSPSPMYGGGGVGGGGGGGGGHSSRSPSREPKAGRDKMGMVLVFRWNGVLEDANTGFTVAVGSQAYVGTNITPLSGESLFSNCCCMRRLTTTLQVGRQGVECLRGRPGKAILVEGCSH